jgi:hypothetical protein
LGGEGRRLWGIERYGRRFFSLKGVLSLTGALLPQKDKAKRGGFGEWEDGGKKSVNSLTR